MATTPKTATPKIENKMVITRKDSDTVALIQIVLDTSQQRASGSGKSWTEYSTGAAGLVITDDQGRDHRIMMTISTPKLTGEDTKTPAPLPQALTMEDLMEAMKQLQAKK